MDEQLGFERSDYMEIYACISAEIVPTASRVGPFAVVRSTVVNGRPVTPFILGSIDRYHTHGAGHQMQFERRIYMVGEEY